MYIEGKGYVDEIGKIVIYNSSYSKIIDKNKKDLNK